MGLADYKSVTSSLKSRITNKGFRYVTADKWINVEMGIIPQGLINDSFSFRFGSQRTTEESNAWLEVDLEVEFILNPIQDAYLVRLSACNNAIMDLQNADNEDLRIYEIEPSFSTNYLGEIIVVTYNSINIEIRNS
tara:strand:- start:4236 stop:4643 length:408 start_codon:yes stop_codon:yes gene_type:complete